MKKIIFAALISSMTMLSCVNQKANQEKSSTDTIVRVKFSGPKKYPEQKMTKGKVTLFGVPKMLADAPATELASSNFETATLPLNVELLLPTNHKAMIKPEVKEGEEIHYYVTLNWDSDGNGTIDTADYMIDFDEAFPTVDINKEVNEIIMK